MLHVFADFPVQVYFPQGIQSPQPCAMKQQGDYEVLLYICTYNTRVFLEKGKKGEKRLPLTVGGSGCDSFWIGFGLDFLGLLQFCSVTMPHHLYVLSTSVCKGDTVGMYENWVSAISVSTGKERGWPAVKGLPQL